MTQKYQRYIRPCLLGGVGSQLYRDATRARLESRFNNNDWVEEGEEGGRLAARDWYLYDSMRLSHIRVNMARDYRVISKRDRNLKYSDRAFELKVAIAYPSISEFKTYLQAINQL